MKNRIEKQPPAPPSPPIPPSDRDTGTPKYRATETPKYRNTVLLCAFCAFSRPSCLLSCFSCSPPGAGSSSFSSIFSWFIPLAVALLLSGCSTPRPLKGGQALTTPNPAGGLTQTLAQGQNPSAPSRQTQETIKVRTYTLPAGTTIEQSPSTDYAPGTAFPTVSPSHCPTVPPSDRNTPSLTLSAPIPVTEREETHATTELGAAQKDTARDLAAKLTSLRPIIYIGALLFVFGLASLFWPPLKLVIGSVTTSVATTLGGAALIVLPSLVVGNELLILGTVVAAVALWFLAHRHGELRGMLAAPPSSQVRTRSTASPSSAVSDNLGSPVPSRAIDTASPNKPSNP